MLQIVFGRANIKQPNREIKWFSTTLCWRMIHVTVMRRNYSFSVLIFDVIIRTSVLFICLTFFFIVF